MALLGGDSLEPRRFFKGEDAGVNCGSSVDLTVAHIFDSDGNDAGSRFVLRPGAMVLVVSKQVFDMPDNVTGHVTHKTTLTKKGIWAQTVGIVDPGWDAPIGTSLLNFSRQDFLVVVGEPFLRVSFMRHDPVPKEMLRKSGGVARYIADLQSVSATQLPRTFLDQDKIVEAAKKGAAKELIAQIRPWGLGISLLLGVLAIVVPLFGPKDNTQSIVVATSNQVSDMNDEMRALDSRVDDLEGRRFARATGQNDSELRGLSP